MRKRLVQLPSRAQALEDHTAQAPVPEELPTRAQGTEDLAQRDQELEEPAPRAQELEPLFWENSRGSAGPRGPREQLEAQ